MKPIFSSLSLSIAAIFGVFVLSGCYTQLAYISDEPNSVIRDPPPIDYQPQTTIVVYEPIYIPTPPVYYPLPTPGYSPTVTETPPPSATRDSGYRRSESSENRQTADSGTRSSGNRRGGN